MTVKKTKQMIEEEENDAGIGNDTKSDEEDDLTGEDTQLKYDNYMGSD